jgi:hypothetical protein
VDQPVMTGLSTLSDQAGLATSLKAVTRSFSIFLQRFIGIFQRYKGRKVVSELEEIFEAPFLIA